MKKNALSALTLRLVSLVSLVSLATLVSAYLLTRPAPNQDPAPARSALPLLKIPPGIPGTGPATTTTATTTTTTTLAALGLATERMVNPLERSADLRAIYEQHRNSPDPTARNTAYRAWSACFPTFVAPRGQAVSLDRVLRALPVDEPGNAQRVDALRALMGRCKNFSDLSREQILDETQRQESAWSNGSALAPGELAAKLLADGDAKRALQAARAAIASRDPAAIDSLRPFINQYLVLQVDAQPEPSNVRPDLRSLAFSIAACRMGLECGSASLTALQLCAHTGACSGSVSDRHMASLPSAADRERLMRDSVEVADAIGSGNYQALGL